MGLGALSNVGRHEGLLGWLWALRGCVVPMVAGRHYGSLGDRPLAGGPGGRRLWSGSGLWPII